jgi:HEAT repeat protein
MQEVLLSPASGLELRKAVVGALDQLGDTRAAQALNEALPRSDDLVLLQLVIEALGKLGGPSSLGALERLARDHPDAFIKDAARDAAASIRGRHPGTR